MKIFVVSLSSSIERRKRIKEQLDSQGFIFEFFNAIDASTPHFLHSERAAPEITYKRKGYYLLDTEIACFASHYELWKRCIDINEPIVILEDNVDLSKDAKTVTMHIDMEKYVEIHPYIKLSSTYKSTFKKVLELENNHHLIRYKKHTCGTTAYIISPIAAKKFVDYADIFIEPVDDYMEKPWIHGVDCIHISPDLFSRSNAESTISKYRKQKPSISAFHKIYIELYRLKTQIKKIIYKIKHER
ncbi:glycosyltransferase family 25 protein [Vibrio sp. S11_S32]|uniref:glycosyltransferase family 25 protein n=1 Tax=Vibrio sp. S11_S32 TaxID=2720225 RepID=UPI001680F5B1|nr:glycosyltransferase family 25 protein [Vibrio sp. S11_S32]MBD1576854.1 glycosyltransferase family 25 protein [Vibrio sp. S11_S32]